MKLFCAKNLVSLSVAPGLPWEFKPTETIPDKARHDKAARQEWYANPNLNHCFYTGLEGTNSNQRPGVGNEPRVVHAFVLDIDLPLPPETILRTVEALPIKPSWWERSLGGNHRMIWLLESPLVTGDIGLTTLVLERAAKWLNIEVFPGVDTNAFTTFSRLYCCGDNWVNLGHPPIPADKSQAFFVACCKDYNFKGAATGFNISLETVEARIRELFPNFSWPSDFSLESKGPSFWIPGSVSPMSAIVKAGGMFTFAAHAEKPFYPWNDLLGAEFMKDYRAAATAGATQDIWYDGKQYWKKVGKIYMSHDALNLKNHLRVAHRISVKPDPSTGVSQLDELLEHIHTYNRIEGAGPFVCRPMGVIEMSSGKRVLNTSQTLIAQPAEDDGVDREFGSDFPYTWSLLSGLFDPSEQVDYVLAWFQRIYRSALYHEPTRGHNIMIMGPAQTGKSLLANEIFGKILGGAADASPVMLHGDNFGGDLFQSALWLVEDDAPSTNPQLRQKFFSKLKQMAANDNHTHNQKFQVSVKVEWFGRVCITANTDLQSATVIPPLDDSSGDKMCLFKTVQKHPVHFADRTTIQALLNAERPYFLRALLKWKAPASVKPEVNGDRYGFVAYHNPALLRLSHKVNDSSSLAEIVSDMVRDMFRVDPKLKVWETSTVNIYRTMMQDVSLERMMRGINVQRFARLILAADRHGLLSVKYDLQEDSDTRQKEWRFHRPENI